MQTIKRTTSTIVPSGPHPARVSQYTRHPIAANRSALFSPLTPLVAAPNGDDVPRRLRGVRRAGGRLGWGCNAGRPPFAIKTKEATGGSTLMTSIRHSGVDGVADKNGAASRGGLARYKTPA